MVNSLEREEPHYFGAGPALLPTAVLQQAAYDLLNYQGSGLGIGEISHRSKPATDVINQSKARLVQLLDIPEDTHEIFFMQGGGTTGFSSIASNLMANFLNRKGKSGKAGYVITGSWSQKSYEEANRLGVDTEIIANAANARGSNSTKFGTIPNVDSWSNNVSKDDTAYIYYCDNETVHGVEFQEFPFEKYEGIPIVADMSSNFLSKQIPISKYGLIMAGAQKNVGIAGLTIYIIRKDLIPQPSDHKLLIENGIPITPIAFHYPSVIKNNSAYNTIPIFTLQVINLVLENLITVKGGLQAQEDLNRKKAEKLYSVLDKYPEIFNLPVEKSVRSKMNVVFTISGGEIKEGIFLKEAEKRYKLTGLKGHRSVGGMRASLYNAVDTTSVDLLCKFIEEFAKEN
ncbi:hypothetical protein PACTADRAFT_43890 [Pachysolen tannophilus NRRL Y-2460]|uniref:phosphoserine transaminase n=1 Tax=Pachysolen tannophilus NRRL Y-2460 TaxID=669874 RepID=A0A1E4TSQ5_PACTA|nr:hypothetical protein PACTADRAFT_43890 [Pachysolen tannophilus NRRL Y-2460]